jgi:hypothetical protein
VRFVPDHTHDDAGVTVGDSGSDADDAGLVQNVLDGVILVMERRIVMMMAWLSW